MKHGVRTSGTNALARMLDFDNLDGLRLFLDYGADPNEAVLDHPSGEPIPTIPALHQGARRGRDGRFAALLLEYGADPTLTWQGRTPYEVAAIYGNTSFAEALAAGGHATPLDPVAEVLAACGRGMPPEGRPLATEALDPEASRILTRVILWPDRFDQAKALVAAGIDPNVPEEMGMPPVHLAGWAGLPEQLAWLLSLGPDLSHVNDYGGDLLGTINHGSENRLDTETRDHVTCARLALEAGAPLRRSDLDGAMQEEMVDFLRDWADAHPDCIEEA
jgi:ankyrin repeat protein